VNAQLMHCSDDCAAAADADDQIIIADAVTDARRRLMSFEPHPYLPARRAGVLVPAVRLPVRRDRSYHVTGSHERERIRRDGRQHSLT